MVDEEVSEAEAAAEQETEGEVIKKQSDELIKRAAEFKEVIK